MAHDYCLPLVIVLQYRNPTITLATVGRGVLRPARWLYLSGMAGCATQSVHHTWSSQKGP